MDASGQNRGCLGFLFPFFGGSEDKKSPGSVDEYPYKLRDDFLTLAERSFYGVIVSVVGPELVVCPKVALKDVFFVSRPNENRAAINRIGQKHVDFLLCSPETMRPVLGVELDDSTHRRSDRRSRDDFVDRVFEAGALPLMRVTARDTYSPQELRASIQRYTARGIAFEKEAQSYRRGRLFVGSVLRRSLRQSARLPEMRRVDGAQGRLTR